MRLGAALCGVLVWLAMGCIATAQGATGDEAPVAFVDAGTLSISCAELAVEEVRVPIRNETAQLQEVGYEIQLADENGDALPESTVCGGLEGARGNVTLGPGASGQVVLGAKQKVDAKSVSGSLVLYAKEGRVARRQVTIAGEHAEKRKLAATPLVSSLSKEVGDSEHGPIWVPIAGEPPVEAGSGAGTQSITLGALSGPGEPVAVTYKGEAESLAGETSKVGLDLDGNLEPGTYKGRVDLNPQDPESGVVELELKVSRSWILAALALFAGIVVGAVLLAASGRMVPGARLRGRVADLSRRSTEAASVLSEAGGGGKDWNRLTIGNLPDLQDRLGKKIKEATEKVLIQIEKTALDGIEAAIGAVETQIDQLLEVPKHALGLEAALQLQRAVHLPKPTEPRPVFEQTAAAALAAGPIDAEAVKPRLDEMDARSNDIKRLRRLERMLEKAWLRYQELKAGGVGALAPVERTLEEGQEELWEAEDGDGLQRSEKKLDSAREQMAEIWRRKLDSDAARASTVSEFSAKDLGGPEGPPPEGMAPQPPGLPEPGTEMLPVSTPAAWTPPPPSAGDAIGKARRLQWAIIVLSGLVAIAAGLGALYVGKTWGTTWDFVAAFIWGITGQAVVSSLATSLDGLAGLSWFGRR